MRHGTAAGRPSRKKSRGVSHPHAQSEAEFRQAVALHSAGRLDEAEKEYARLLASGPEKVGLLSNFGVLRRAQGRLDEAIALYQRGLRIDPDHPDLNHNLGNALKAARDFPQAETHLRRALARRPEAASIHASLGAVLLEQGKTSEAEAACRKAIALDQRDKSAHRTLAMALDRLGRADDALAHFRTVLELDPADESVRYILAAREGERVATAPEGYVRKLFDGFAPYFDDKLVSGLGYCAPKILCALLEFAVPAERRFRSALDIGCGTGLMGQVIRARCDRLEGVDLSAAMVAAARRKAIYDALHVADVTAWLSTAPGSFDLITAADVMVYIGDLQPLFHALAAKLAPDGVFLCSTELLTDGEWCLAPSGRFQHTAPYVDGAAQAAGLRVRLHRAAAFRQDHGEPVPGGFYLIARADATLSVPSTSDCTAAVAHLKAGRLDMAIASLEDLLAAHPNHLRGLQLLGIALARQKRREEAITVYQRGLALAPDDVLINRNLGSLLAAAGQLEAAIVHLRRAQAKLPDDAPLTIYLARTLSRHGENEEAERLLREVVAKNPQDAVAHAYLGRVLRICHRYDEAIPFLRRAVELDPADEQSGYALAALEQQPVAMPPPSVVARLFDDYAQNFDEELIDKLAYRMPQQLMDLLTNHVGRDARFARVLDLGCGTGLFGEPIRSRCDYLEGVDLSSKMIEACRAKGLYDALRVGDALAALEENEGPFDLVAAADVFVYFGDLSPVFSAIAARLKPGGWFLFSTEEIHDGGLWRLFPTGRFAHPAAYVTRCGEQAGFEIKAHVVATIRKERGIPVAGGLFLLQRPRVEGLT